MESPAALDVEIHWVGLPFVLQAIQYLCVSLQTAEKQVVKLFTRDLESTRMFLLPSGCDQVGIQTYILVLCDESRGSESVRFRVSPTSRRFCEQPFVLSNTVSVSAMSAFISSRLVLTTDQFAAQFSGR